MARVVVGMTVSLDGFVNDRNGSVEALYPDLDVLGETETMQEEIRNTGAVVMGRNTYAMADDPDSYAVDYEYQAPIHVLTHRIPNRHPKESGTLTFTFVTDGIESAVRQAKAAAGAKDVVVIGASTIRQCLRAGLADVLTLDIMPVLLGEGLPFLGGIGIEPVRYERMDTVVLPGGRTRLMYRVVR
ncbi:MAG: dihydrofolate reductase family protein [Anaerolineae bacterium]